MQNRVPGGASDVQRLIPALVFVDRTSICPVLFSIADRIHDLISQTLSFFQSPSKEKATLSQDYSSNTPEVMTLHKNSSISMSREEVKFVMEKFEFFCSQESDDQEIKKCFGVDEISDIFYESEPSLVELKQTFNVFDKNRDGFIDSEELHRVLGLLGSNQGLFIHDCKRMIARFDHNKDGKIDFNEFVMLMEIALS